MDAREWDSATWRTKRKPLLVVTQSLRDPADRTDIHDLLQAPAERVLALGEALCVFHSRSSVTLKHLRAVEA